MPAIPLVGQSYQLRARNVDYERTVNYLPVRAEGEAKGGFQGYLRQAAGLSSALVSKSGAVRCLAVARETLYAVIGDTLWQIAADWTATSKGTLLTSSGVVDWRDNNTQLALTDGPHLYVLDLDTSAFATDPANWRGSANVEVVDGYGIFADPETTQFYLSANQDFAQFNVLDFASAEGSTGAIVGHIVNRRDLYLLKTNNLEIWSDVGGDDFPFARNDGANIEVGCSAAHTICKAGGVVYWLGRDERGAAVVYAMPAYSPTKISSIALDEALATVTDLSGAYAWTYHQEGSTGYVLQVPGLPTTWRFDIEAGIWTELGEWVDGDWARWRADCHAYVYGVHVVGDAAGKVYRLDPNLNTYAGDPLVRERISPNIGDASMKRRRYGSLQLDCQVGLGKPDGTAGTLMMRYSDDGGRTWKDWRYLSLGAIGQYRARARASMLGASRQRMWQFRVTDDVRCDLLSAIVDEV